MQLHKFQVALSFAREQEDYALSVARLLQMRGVATFFDKDFRAEMWGSNLPETLYKIYAKDSQLVLMLISREYVSKVWCKHECRAAISRALKEDGTILPVRFDDAWPEGLVETLTYESANKTGPAELAALIAKRLGVVTPFKLSQTPPPKQSAPSGYVSFDCSDYNGRFIIGDGPYEFETAWSTANKNIAVAYDGRPSIRGVALAANVSGFGKLKDVSKLNFTSSHRRAHVGDIVVYQNQNEFYAGLKLTHVLSRAHGDTHDEVGFHYLIAIDGSDDLSKYGID